MQLIAEDENSMTYQSDNGHIHVCRRPKNGDKFVAFSTAHGKLMWMGVWECDDRKMVCRMLDEPKPLSA